MRVRGATLSDVSLLIELAGSTFRDTYLPYDDPDEIEGYIAEHFTATVFGRLIDDPHHRLLLAEVDGVCIGYAHLLPSPAPACVVGAAPWELKRFYLHHAHHGKGHGAAFLRAVRAEAHATGARTLWLCVYEKNRRAREFYARSGFADVGITEFLFAGRSYYDPVMATPIS